MSENEELANALAESINDDSDQKVAYFLNDDESPTEIDRWVSTGSTVLDMKISNRIDGGLPVGKVCEFHGAQGSGKSLLATHVLANTQRAGGVPVLIDTEHSASSDFLETIGLKKESLVYISENRIEQIFKIIENLIVEVRERSDKNSDNFTTIVVDSVAGATTEKEMEEDYDKEGYNTDKAIVLSKSMRKLTRTFGNENVLIIFTNQIRANVGSGPFSPDYVVPGGKAIPFHSSVRIRMRDTSKIRDGTDIIGAELKPEIVKNRLAPPKRKVKLELKFESGIQDLDSIMQECKNHDIINHSGAGWHYITLKDENGERNIKWKKGGEDDKFSFQGKNFAKVFENDQEFREVVLEELKDEVLIDYEGNWVGNSNNDFEDGSSENED